MCQLARERMQSNGEAASEDALYVLDNMHTRLSLVSLSHTPLAPYFGVVHSAGHGSAN